MSESSSISGAPPQQNIAHILPAEVSDRAGHILGRKIEPHIGGAPERPNRTGIRRLESLMAKLDGALGKVKSFVCNPFASCMKNTQADAGMTSGQNHAHILGVDSALLAGGKNIGPKTTNGPDEDAFTLTGFEDAKSEVSTETVDAFPEGYAERRTSAEQRQFENFSDILGPDDVSEDSR